MMLVSFAYVLKNKGNNFGMNIFTEVNSKSCNELAC